MSDIADASEASDVREEEARAVEGVSAMGGKLEVSPLTVGATVEADCATGMGVVVTGGSKPGSVLTRTAS